MIEDHFARPAHLLRWRREKLGGGEKLSSELLYSMKVSTC